MRFKYRKGKGTETKQQTEIIMQNANVVCVIKPSHVNVVSVIESLIDSNCSLHENKVKYMSNDIVKFEKKKANIVSSLNSLKQKIRNGQATAWEKSQIKYLLQDKVRLEQKISDLKCKKRASEKVISQAKRDKSTLKTYELMQKTIKP